jgi:urease accessory protein
VIGARQVRDDPAWYTPADLPAELLAFDSSVQDGLAVGSPGKVGLLDLLLAPCGGVTRVQRLYQRGPLHIYRPVHLDPCRPDMAFIYMLQSGDGLVQGDRYRIDVDCAPGSAAHLTTLAATNVFAARQNFATQLVNLRAAAGSVLEYLPDPLVPFRGSRLFARTCVTANADSIVILGEILLPGRVAHGEAHVYDLYWSETEVRRPDGRLLFADVLRLRPEDGRDPRSMVLLGPYDVVATLYVITTRVAAASLVAELRSAVAACAGVVAGISELPNDGGAAVRILGPTSMAVRAAMRTAWNAARVALLGAPSPNLRKGELVGVPVGGTGSAPGAASGWR